MVEVGPWRLGEQNGWVGCKPAPGAPRAPRLPVGTTGALSTARGLAVRGRALGEHAGDRPGRAQGGEGAFKSHRERADGRLHAQAGEVASGDGQWRTRSVRFYFLRFCVPYFRN